MSKSQEQYIEHEEYKRANLPENWDGMLGISYVYFCGKAEGIEHD